MTPETERTQREDYTAFQILYDGGFRRRAEELLRAADLGVSGVEVEQAPSQRPMVRLLHEGGVSTPLWAGQPSRGGPAPGSC
ncbi:hypothetical protein AB0D11_35290 [Streptomyces monashensis]|uniref:hypothetical protein n=1 Tax=Streptomyces monashensis TaxID=1678012 RepID=UPI0033F08997